MTRVLKAIPTLFTAFGASLPTATKDHRGQLVWKRASGAEDEIHAGVVDSSNVAQFRRILTKTYADTVYVPLIQASAVSPYTQAPSIADSAVTASTSDTANYSVNVTMSFTLPAGTWAVYAWAAGLFSHSSANGIVRVHLQVGNDAGTALTSPCQANPGRTTIAVANHATGQTGTITIALEYRPNASGTAYAGGGYVMAQAFRTA